MNLDDALQTFTIECRELLEQMEAALLRIEQDPADVDTINAIFRAAHTIKGSAGLFGNDHMVTFTHAAETVLDKVRRAELPITSELVALFLSVHDHLGVLVECVADGSEPDADTQRGSTALIVQLGAYLDVPPDAATVATGPAAEHADGRIDGHAGERTGEHADVVDGERWHISLRFHSEVLKNGMDPLAFIRYLTTFGKIARIVTLAEAVPPLLAMNAEACYLGFEISYESDADEAAIEGAFEFVRNDADISILPPRGKLDDYRRLIEKLPEGKLRIGEILVRCGTLTRAELDRALGAQDAGADDACRVPGEMPVARQARRPGVAVAALDQHKQAQEHARAEGSLIRVNAEKLDEHINLIGELIIASAGTSLIAQRVGAPELTEAAARLSRLVEEVRDSALTLRMVQIGATFTKFQRVVRDMSAELNKDIRLEICGAETELDKTVVEKIGDPLTHLVRNSLDHGIEAAERRIAAGKPAHGLIRLNAYHDSGSIVIEVSDDGGGLDKQRIFRKAVEQGLVKPDQPLSDGEIYNLIFEAGFSTVEQVSNLSGRGVGMDVVRRNITALRGTVEIDSSEGVGTTMRIRLPLTLAIIDGFLVGVGAAHFVVPLDMVVECVELSCEETQAAQGRDHLNLRGEVLPFIRLKDLFEIPAPPAALADDGAEGPATGAGAAAGMSPTGVMLTAEGAAALAADPELAFILHPVKRENVVVVQYAGHRAGLAVENLLGEFQTVIRPLGVVFNGLDGMSGFTILGNGNVALILDVPGLVRRVAGSENRRNAAAAVRAIAE